MPPFLFTSIFVSCEQFVTVYTMLLVLEIVEKNIFKKSVKLAIVNHGGIQWPSRWSTMARGIN